MLLGALTANTAEAQETIPDAPSPGVSSRLDANSQSQSPIGAANARIAPGAASAEAPAASPVNAIDGKPPQINSLLFAPTMNHCLPNACSASGPMMSCQPENNPFQRFLRQTPPPPRTPRDKLIMAGKDVIDPFNILTIVGGSAIAIAANADSVYGPGMPGFARDMGVSFTQDLTSEFFGTFLIPSLVHQDPRFHRMPNASMQRRVAHAIYQVVWTQSDTGKPMFNYANVVGTVADDLISDLYVPGRRHDAGATADRLSTALATDPIDNFVTEFLPDLARHVNIHVVFVQRLINRVALDENQTHF
jgi:hypothetical protein